MIALAEDAYSSQVAAQIPKFKENSAETTKLAD
jgi:hypothetical protein